VLHDFPEFDFLSERFANIGKELLLFKADIILLQEVPWQHDKTNNAETLANTLDMNYLYFRANGNRTLIGFEEGVAILSRFPLSSTHFTALDPQAGFFENRVVLHAVANTPQGAIDLFVTHLTGGNSSNNADQINSLTAFVNEHVIHTAVIAGDFNAKDNSPQIQELPADWIDSFRLFHPTEPGWTCCQNELTKTAVSTLSERIDYLFIRPFPSQEVEIIDAKHIFDSPVPGSPPLWVSDHTGLSVTFTLTQK
jgi:endonuclease/exonuclease/phosphatase family metal-dependent hydrolase